MNSNETQETTEGKEIIEASVKNFDKEIQINWELLTNDKKIDSIEIFIKGKGVNHKKKFSVNEKKYSFVKGKHGNGYAITILAKNGKKTVGKYNTRAVFLDYDKLPDLPIISINTRNGKSPTFKPAEKPRGVVGATITDNEYLECEMVMTINGVKIADSRAKFRVRGNTSAKLPNKPYKLELKNAADLLELGNAYADKEWVLLNVLNNFKTYFATELANLFGVEWQPRIRFVNLMVNGKWEGCYILSESVKRSPKRVNISHSGYIFEHDPYFWKPNTTYFKTTHTRKAYGYTFKYPKKKNLSQYDIGRLKQHLQEFEDLLENKDERYTEYIDMDSFTTWILFHDLTGNVDGAGSNMYFYKYDFDLENPNSTKIKRGPLWDFSGAFIVTDDWSKVHYHANFLKQLFQIPSFRQAYKDKFYTFKDKIVPALKSKSGKFRKNQGKAIQESWNLHATLWNLQPKKVGDDIKDKLNFLEHRIKWIDNKFKTDDWE